MTVVWATMPYVQLSHNRQNQICSEMSLRDVMELPLIIYAVTCDIFYNVTFSGNEKFMEKNGEKRTMCFRAKKKVFF